MFITVVKRASSLSFAVTCCTICQERVGLSGFEVQKKFPISSLTPVWYHVPSHWAAHCHGSQASTYEGACRTLFEATVPWARWSQGLHTHKDTYNPGRKPIFKHWSFSTQSLPTLFYNICGLFARSLGCHYVVQCLDLQELTLWFGGRMLSFTKTKVWMWFNPLCLNISCHGH